MSFHRYTALGIAVVMVVLVFVVFSDEDGVEPDMSGIATDIRSGTNGYTFYLETEDSKVRCFSSERPEELGHYGVRGSYSDDRTIFFVSVLISYDGR